MLDKTVPYKNIVMKIPAEQIALIEEPALPSGFRFAFYEDGRERDWAQIEASVLEFDSPQLAEEYFRLDYLPHRELLKQRCLFVLGPDGTPAATATAWFAVSVLGYQPSLHWVAVRPDYQGLGLGKAVIQKATRLFLQTDAGRDVLLHTQTWSHKAIRIYQNLGYHLCKSERIAVMSNGPEGTKVAPNEFEEALAILRTRLDAETCVRLRESAI